MAQSLSQNRTHQHQQSAIFASVFPAGSVKPPPNHIRFEPRADDQYSEADVRLRDGCRMVLGVGGEGNAFGAVDDAPGNATYRTRYVNCCSMKRVHASPEALEAEARKWDSFRLWSMAARWTREMGGERLRRLFALVLDGCVRHFVTWSYAGVYEESESEVVIHMCFWIRHVFSPFVVRFLDVVRVAEGAERRPQEVREKDVKVWENWAITLLGELRIVELFDIVVDWDVTKSGIDDLKHYTTTPATRKYATSSFIKVLQLRLLQPGASTVEILQIYISIIRAFRRLDPKGVLLDRIASIIRRSLRERDDTAKVIVSGLLSDTVDENGEPLPGDPETLMELALELNRHDEHTSKNDADLDWDNMEWMPDPIDAAPDYMKSKNTDVIGSLISLFDSRDVFVRELQTALADRLLKKKPDYDQEVSVLEHLKLRLGSSSLQPCEVMLRDVLDSRKVDNVIRADQGMSTAIRPPSASKDPTAGGASDDQPPEFHSKILSRLFWPTLQDQAFTVPAAILAQQARYATGFESLKQSRKLTWLNALGHVEVELDLADRIFRDDVLPWQAAVIYAFRSAESDIDKAEPISRSVSSLAAELSMSPTLVRSACIFWLSKRILSSDPAQPDVYTVLETLPESSSSSSTSAQAAASAQPAAAAAAAAEVAAQQAIKEAEAAELAGKMAVYGQFVVSLLTNQGAMPAARIQMMLGIVVPGGFPLAGEELREFLNGLVGQGKIEVGVGGVYRAV